MKRQSGVYAVLIAVLCVAGSALGSAQKTITQKNVRKDIATITAINKATRVVTLKNTEGRVEEIVAGPEVQRFDELHVGDKVTFSYQESLVYQIRKPGQAPSASAATNSSNIVRSTGPRPGGTVTERQTKTVTVEAIDKKEARISVRTAEGHGIIAIVDDKGNLNGIKVGDKVDITYTEALMITVENAR